MTAAVAKPRFRVKAGSRPIPAATRAGKAPRTKAKPLPVLPPPVLPAPVLPLDAEMVRKARKVWLLYVNVPMEGVHRAADARLEEMAAKCGMDRNAFLTACGLEAVGPAGA